MAVDEGIRSHTLAQPWARSPKQRVYEGLFLLNQGVDRVIASLRGLERFLIPQKESLQCAQAEIEEVRAAINADFLEYLSERERLDEGRFWKQRRKYEEKLKDPDDVYLNVEQREEERKQQGLPSRLGVIPHSAVAEKEKLREVRHTRKAKLGGKGRKRSQTD